MSTQIQSASRTRMIELIMTMVGRSKPNPREFRTRLEAMDQYELEQFYNVVMNTEHAELKGAQ